MWPAARRACAGRRSDSRVLAGRACVRRRDISRGLYRWTPRSARACCGTWDALRCQAGSIQGCGDGFAGEAVRWRHVYEPCIGSMAVRRWSTVHTRLRSQYCVPGPAADAMTRCVHRALRPPSRGCRPRFRAASRSRRAGAGAARTPGARGGKFGCPNGVRRWLAAGSPRAARCGFRLPR